MAKLISDILGTREPDFSMLINKWERQAGMPGVDIRLSSELSTGAQAAIKELGLDEGDTTNKELYHALIKRSRDDSARLDTFLSVSNEDTPQEAADKVIKFATKTLGDKKVWVMKPSVSKRLLKKTPPKKLMKILGYRSIDSVIKRELPIYLVALGGRADNSFQKKMIAEYKRLKPADFDVRSVDVSILAEEKINKLRKNHISLQDLVVPVYETGSLLVIIPEKRYPGDTLLLLGALLEGFRGLRMHSAYFRALSVRPKFGDKFAQTIEYGLARVSKNFVTTGWSSLHQLTNQNPEEHPEELEPHVQAEDMQLPSLKIFEKDIPELNFWDKNVYVVRSDDTGSVSLNLLDVMINDLNDFHYHENLRLYAQGRLWDELSSRYMAHPSIKLVVVKLG